MVFEITKIFLEDSSLNFHLFVDLIMAFECFCVFRTNEVVYLVLNIPPIFMNR